MTNNYSFDSHDTVFNTNNITKVWADHSTVDVNNETHNVAAGGVDVEGANNGTVATGGHNQIGDGNEQSGDGSTTAFGSGSALSHVATGDGGAINTGTGSASGNAEHANFQNFGDGNLTAATHAPATASNVDSHDHVSTDSHNDSSLHTDSHDDNSVDSSTNDSNNPHTESTTDHSFNTETDNSLDSSTHVDHGQIDNGLLFAH